MCSFSPVLKFKHISCLKCSSKLPIMCWPHWKALLFPVPHNSMLNTERSICQSGRNPKNTIPKQALQSSALPLTQKVTSYTGHFCQKASKMPLTLMLTRAKNSQAYPVHEELCNWEFFPNKSKLSFNLPGFSELNCISHSLWTRQIQFKHLQTVTSTHLNIKERGGKTLKLQTLLRSVIPQKHPTAFLSQD